MVVARTVAFCLLLVTAAVSVIAPLAEDRGAGAPDALVRQYFAALTNGDTDEALEALAPAARARWATFAQNGVFNDYRVQGVAVRQASLFDALRSSPAGPRDVTVFVEVTEAVSGAQWQAGPTIPLVVENARVYLARPPLA